MSGQRRSLAGLVVSAGLGVALVVGQAGRYVHQHQQLGAQVRHAAGVAVDALVVVIVAAAVCLGWYLRHGRWIPGRYRADRLELGGPGEGGERPAVAVLEVDGKIFEWSDGVWVGPSVPPVEDDNAPVLPNTRAFLDDPREESEANSAV